MHPIINQLKEELETKGFAWTGSGSGQFWGISHLKGYKKVIKNCHRNGNWIIQNKTKFDKFLNSKEFENF
jgi:hypothetical protein